MSYVVANRVFVKPEFAAEFERRFAARAGQIELQPGFESMQVLKPKSQNTPWVVLTRWTGEQAFVEWTKSDDFRLAHNDPMPREAFGEGGGLERYEVVVDTRADKT